MHYKNVTQITYLILIIIVTMVSLCFVFSHATADQNIDQIEKTILLSRKEESDYFNTMLFDIKLAKSTKTPRPTSTPVTIPPPSNPTATNILVILGVIIVIVIMFGVWINRKRINGT